MPFSDRNFIFEKVYKEGLHLPAGRVFQIAELSVVRGGEVPEHRQRCDEITYVISGSAKMESNGTEACLSAGQIHYVGKDCLHRIIADDTENFRYICIGFIAEETEELSAFLELARQKKTFVLNDDSTVKKLTELIVDEFYSWDDKSNRMVSRYLAQILVTLHRLLEGKVTKLTSGETASANLTVYRIIRHIDKEFAHIKNVQEIAETLCYNECYLSHLFREKTGMTLKDYLTRRKIAEACNQLTYSVQSIESIAESTGFPSAHTFRRAFKECTGKSPTDYRNNKTANFGW